ncbi:MAG: sulfite exporter TauE/SafE family protein [candidate division Zixibacteria bacterium]|nr:sulfite exporter TauE/SafE family protein [candidate division Zixibacteria bacterium]
MLSGADILWISVLLMIVAALYSSVGHGGASGYLAVMTLFAIPPQVMSSTALLLNVLVSLISLIMFRRSGHVSIGMIWPFLIGSVPAAFIGGLIRISPSVYAVLLALALIAAAVRLAVPFNGVRGDQPTTNQPGKLLASMIGAGIGFLSGIVGIGGGIFLGPVLLLKGWANAHQTAGICAGFILINSLSGLAGRLVQGSFQIGPIGYFVLAALAGGLIGSYMGARKFRSVVLRRLLALALVVAAIKVLVTTG